MGQYADRAREMFLQGYNCCQAVVGAFAELYGFEPVIAMRMCEGFGGGLGRMRLTCGAVNAMAIVAGMKMSHGQPGDLKRRGEIYAVVRKMVEEFKADNGTIVCAELLGLALPKDNSPTPEERTPDYYARRPCPDKIYQCALLVEKYLVNENV